ncbi:MAG: efflux RND transporter permease subunit, partial [Bacteroidales bacterium]|nr:efflux RND transporter permease subunit [Bacteroidales bacterium]
IYNGAAEVSSAILTAVSTTIVSFIPVFTMQAAEGKLFGPLAFTKTFALVAALIVTLFILPMLAHWFFGARIKNRQIRKWINFALLPLSIILLITGYTWAGMVLLALGLTGTLKSLSKGSQGTANAEGAYGMGGSGISDGNGTRPEDVPGSDALPKDGPEKSLKEKFRLFTDWLIEHAELLIVLIGVVWLLAKYWLPLGAGKSLVTNALFVALLLVVILGAFKLLEHFYKSILKWCLDHKIAFLSIPSLLILLGVIVWMGFDSIFGFAARGFDAAGMNIRTTKVWSSMAHSFPGMGKEFMPSLDEGSFLLMPTSMPHSGVEYNRKVLGQLDMLLANIPEVELAVGKLGRVESALDPAPISMYENVINYKPEYMLNEKGHRARFKTDKNDRFILH